MGELGQQRFPEISRRFLGEAVGDADISAVPEAPLFYHIHQHLGGFSQSSGLMHRGDLAALGLSRHPDAQHSGDLRHGDIHPTVSCQVVHGFQAEQGVQMVVIIQHLFLRGLEIVTRVLALTDLLRQHHHFRPCGERIKDKHLSLRMLGHVRIGSVSGRVVAARQVLGNGDAENSLSVTEGFQPLPHVGAGGAGLSLILLQILHHLCHVQICVVHIFPFRHDLHGNGCKRAVLPGDDVAGRIRYNFVFHTDPSITNHRFFNNRCYCINNP